VQHWQTSTVALRRQHSVAVQQGLKQVPAGNMLAAGNIGHPLSSVPSPDLEYTFPRYPQTSSSSFGETGLSFLAFAGPPPPTLMQGADKTDT
jgi:hypothetical protein